MDYKKSRKVTFVNSSVKEERVILPKSEDMLDHMEEDEENVYMTSTHEHYTVRPDNLEHICLEKFAVNYDTCGGYLLPIEMISLSRTYIKLIMRKMMEYRILSRKS